LALQFLFELGLHKENALLVSQGKLEESEAKCRTTLFLAAFLYDTLWSWFLGRPRRIALEIVPQSKLHEPADAGMTHLSIWVKLCSFIAQVGDILNAPLPLDYVALSRLSQLRLMIRECQDCLPSGLNDENSKISELDAPAYALNTCFCMLQINILRIPLQLCRPNEYVYIHKDDDMSLPGITPGDSRAIIHENAVRVAQLAKSFVQIHGVEQMVPTMLENIFVAALSLIQHILHNQQLGVSYERDMGLLRFLSLLLEKVEKHYHLACRINHALYSIVENTSLAGTFTHQRCQVKLMESLPDLDNCSNSARYQFDPGLFGSDWVIETTMRETG
jgi:hypothetical protein